MGMDEDLWAVVLSPSSLHVVSRGGHGRRRLARLCWVLPTFSNLTTALEIRATTGLSTPSSTLGPDCLKPSPHFHTPDDGLDPIAALKDLGDRCLHTQPRK
jgi:hypothetical protein